MRISLVIMALLGTLACKGKSDSASSAPDPSAAKETLKPVETTSQSVFTAGDKSAAGYVLGVLSGVDAPLLTGDPACASYATNMRSLLADMSQTLRRLRERAKTGLAHDQLLGFTSWLDKRAGMLEHLSRSRSMAEGELGRRHREFAAAASDLAGALAESYGAPDNELGADDITRLRNAADNFAATVQALEKQCQGQ